MAAKLLSWVCHNNNHTSRLGTRGFSRMRRGASSAARLNRNRKSRMKSLWHPEHFGYGQDLNSFEKHITKSDYPVHRCCFIFLFVLFENIGERARKVNKSPAVFVFLSRAFGGLWRKSRGSGNRQVWPASSPFSLLPLITLKGYCIYSDITLDYLPQLPLRLLGFLLLHSFSLSKWNWS